MKKYIIGLFLVVFLLAPVLSSAQEEDDVVASTYTAGTAYREVSQSATFTHNYSVAGTYNPTFIVINSNDQSATTSLSINVN